MNWFVLLASWTTVLITLANCAQSPMGPHQNDIQKLMEHYYTDLLANLKTDIEASRNQMEQLVFIRDLAMNGLKECTKDHDRLMEKYHDSLQTREATRFYAQMAHSFKALIDLIDGYVAELNPTASSKTTATEQASTTTAHPRPLNIPRAIGYKNEQGSHIVGTVVIGALTLVILVLVLGTIIGCIRYFRLELARPRSNIDVEAPILMSQLIMGDGDSMEDVPL